MAKGSVERLKQLKHIASKIISWTRERKFAEWGPSPLLRIHISHRKTSCDKINDKETDSSRNCLLSESKFR